MIIRRTSPVTGKVNEMDLNVTEDQLKLWREGSLIQSVMPHLSASEREFIISGCTEEDWNTLFGAEDSPE